MPYDGSNFERPPQPPPRRLSAGEERALLVAIGLLLLLMLALPVPFSVLADLGHAVPSRR